MKIVYIIPTLEAKGGAERIIVEKANYLSAHYGYNISIVTQCQHYDAPIVYPLSEKIHHINLGIPYYSQYKYKFLKRLWIKWKINKRLQKETRSVILRIDPEILIGVSFFRPDIVCKIPCKALKIIESHEPKNLLQSSYFNGSWASKLFMKHHLHSVEKNADIVVGLTNETRKQWKKAKCVKVIPNFSSMEISQYSTCNAKRVIAVGRLTPVKGYERLIKIWKIVHTKHPDWRLDVFGDGSLKKYLSTFISDNNIKNITLHGVTHNISLEYANSSICALTSYYEGFSLVILEAMRHGVPCIAFDCPNGPRNIIINNKSGYLIKDGDIKLFAERLCNLIENQQLRKLFSNAAIERSKVFDIDIIMEQWKALFESQKDCTSK